MSIDFTNRKELFNSEINEKFDKIYKLIHFKKNTELIFQLDKLRELLITNYNTAAYQYPTEYANKIFSEFLQHLFFYIANNFKNKALVERDKKENYINNICLSILNQYQEYFFYTSSEGTAQTTIWFDHLTEDSALTIACKYANAEVVEQLLALVKKNCKEKRVGKEYDFYDFTPLWQNYLFHENNEHLSAWNIAWLEGKNEIHQAFMRLGMVLAQESMQFNEYLLQKDVQGDSVLIKAVKNRELILVNAFIEKINKVYGGKMRAGFPYFLHEQNNRGFTALNVACELGDLEIVKRLLKAAHETFITRSELWLFLSLPNNEQVSPLINASKLGASSIVFTLLRFSHRYIYDFSQPRFFFDFINKEDEYAYSSLMWAIKLNHIEVIKEFIKMCEKSITHEMPEEIYSRVLGFVNTEGLSTLQLACQAYHAEAVLLLVYGMDMLELSNQEYKNFINHIGADKLSPLSKIVLEENKLQEKMRQESRAELSIKEKDEVEARRSIAKILLSYDADSEFARSHAPEGWEFLQNTQPSFSSLIGFFELFCSLRSSTRKKRYLNNLNAKFCLFSTDDYLPSVSFKQPLQIRREALLNLHAFIKQSNLDSLKQVGIIRNQVFISERESQELIRFREVVNRYYLKNSNTILDSIKKIRVLNLQAALEANTDYILLDSQTDLLVLNKDKVFFSLLSPIHALAISTPINKNAYLIERWLELYFSETYTIHPFNSECIFALAIEELSQHPIYSDSLFIKLPIEGLSRKVVQALFLLNGKMIKTLDIVEDNFFQINIGKLSFQVEYFHLYFFDLSISEKLALKNILLRYPISTRSYYESLNNIEKIYLESYAGHILHLIRNTEVVDIKISKLLISSIKAHEAALLQENDLNLIDKKTLITALEAFNTRLEKGEKIHFKVALQLLVFFFPSIIRSIADQNPFALVIPVGMMISDIALKHLLVCLAKHPKIRQLFPGELSHKLLKITGMLGERTPVLGSALAIYGLIESGKAVTQVANTDPNRSYYIELLLNNLATLVLMGAELSVTLPFWPVLSMFAVLTGHQIEVEGAIQKNQLHLKDDQGHLLLMLYDRIELGLGIINERIKIIFRQRELLEAQLDYLSQLQANESTYAVMSVILPDIEKINVSVPCVQSPANEYSLLTISGLPLLTCKETRFFISKKRNYSFELGEIRNSCQKSDALSLNKNYTLLAGSFTKDSFFPWIDCALGKRKLSYGLATAEGNTAAGLIIDNIMSKKISEQRYSIFLPVDSFQVANFNFKFKAGTGKPQIGDSEVDKLLPCAYPLSYCINKIVVAVVQLYSIQAHDSDTKTEIFIDNHELKVIDGFDKELQYIIARSDKLRLTSLGINKQSFIFLNESRVLQFVDGKLQTTQGFESDLTSLKELRLEFTNTYWVQGYFEVPAGQSIIINRLQGLSEEQLVILNTTLASSCTVGLCANSRFINQGIQIDIYSAKNKIILWGYGIAHAQCFYQFKHSFNLFVVYKVNEALEFKLLDAKLINFEATVRLSLIDTELPATIVFSGLYYIESTPYFSRIIISKLAGSFQPYLSTLEINISKNLSDQIDISAIQAQQFYQLSLIETNMDKFICKNYIFLQKELFPEVKGDFASFRFINYEENLVIALTHKDDEIQTFLLMDKLQTRIVINKIHYKINWFASSLLAMGNHEEDEVIDASQLLTPINIDVNLDKVDINIDDTTLNLGQLIIKHAPLKLQIHARDRKVPFSFLKYKKTIGLIESMHPVEDIASVGELVYARSYIKKLYENHKFAPAKNIEPTQESWSSFLYEMATITLTSLGGVAVVTFTGLGFLFSRRLLRPKLAAAVVSGPVISPLLHAEGVETQSIKRKNKKGCSQKNFSDDKESYIDFWRNDKECQSAHIECLEEFWSKQQTKNMPHPMEWENIFNQIHFNEQAIFSFYVMQNLRKIFKRSKSANHSHGNSFSEKQNIGVLPFTKVNNMNSCKVANQPNSIGLLQGRLG